VGWGPAATVGRVNGVWLYTHIYRFRIYRYFYVPAVCKYIAKTSMDRLVANVNRTNNEAKLKDFIERLRHMYGEVILEKPAPSRFY
jgi:hypothetical protein